MPAPLRASLSPPFFPDLSPADVRHIEAARGFLGLGLNDEAWRELEEARPTARASAVVMALRVEILLALGKTDYAAAVAEHAVELHPEEARCQFALSLVHAHIGDMEAASAALGAALALDMGMRRPALDDSRLTAFWQTLGE